MIEFLNTLDPVQLSFFIAFLILALVILGIGSHHRINEIYDIGYEYGKSDLDGQIIKAESDSYRKGLIEGRNAGWRDAEKRFNQDAQKFNALDSKPTSSPVKQPSKPTPSKQKNANRSVKAVTTAKKPVRVAQSSRPRTKAKSS